MSLEYTVRNSREKQMGHGKKWPKSTRAGGNHPLEDHLAHITDANLNLIQTLGYLYLKR